MSAFCCLLLVLLLLPASSTLWFLVGLMVFCFIFLGCASFVVRVEHSHEILNYSVGFFALLCILLASTAEAHLLQVGKLVFTAQELVVFLARAVATRQLFGPVFLLGASLVPRLCRILLRLALL